MPHQTRGLTHLLPSPHGRLQQNTSDLASGKASPTVRACVCFRGQRSGRSPGTLGASVDPPIRRD